MAAEDAAIDEKLADTPDGYAKLLRRLADEPHNQPIRDKITEIARKFDDLAEKARGFV